MNNTQRKYLTDTISAKIQGRIKEIETGKMEVPNLSAYVLHLILSNNFEIKNTESIREILMQKALKGASSQRPAEFLSSGDRWGGSGGFNKVAFTIEELFILPESYQKLINEAHEHNFSIQEQTNKLRMQMEGLITRITLASDSTLQKMINEVDDMGDISLIDMKIKLLN